MSETGSLLVLTAKGAEELRARVHRLDVKARNILFLIHMGSQNLEAILEKTIFPRNEVATKVYALLEGQFIALDFRQPVSPAGPSLPPIKTPTLTSAPLPAQAPQRGAMEAPVLQAGVSLSQTRFALSDFCLDCFGIEAQRMIGAIDRCTNLNGLQQVLNTIFAVVRKDQPDQLPALYARVEEINASYR